MIQVSLHWKARWNHSHNWFSCVFSRCANNYPVQGNQEPLFKFFSCVVLHAGSSNYHPCVGRSLEYFEDCYMWEWKSECFEVLIFFFISVWIISLDMKLIIALKHSKNEFKWFCLGFLVFGFWFFYGLWWSNLKPKRLPAYKKIMDSYNYLGWKRPLKSFSPTISLIHTSPPLNWFPQDHIYVSFKYLRGWGLHHSFFLCFTILCEEILS